MCSQKKLWFTTVKNCRKGHRPGLRINDDLLRWNFTAAQPNRKWVTHLTKHATTEGTFFCCAIKDLLSNRIVEQAVSDRMTADLAVAALRTALARRAPDGVEIAHANRGTRWRARSFQAVLNTAGHQGSTGRVAPTGDNAPTESFWALLQRNVMNTGLWRTQAEPYYAITYGIEHTHKRRRRRLDRLTPI